VYNAQEVINDGKVKLRLSDATTINGKKYPKGYVFEATTALHEGQMLVHAVALGVSCYNSKNRDGGQNIMDRQKSKGKVFLTEGESIKLYY